MPKYEVLQRWVNKLLLFCVIGFCMHSIYEACRAISDADKLLELKEVRGGDST